MNKNAVPSMRASNAIALVVACVALSWAAFASADVYRCETRSGVVFTDGRCPAGARGQVWSIEKAAPGIVATGDRRVNAGVPPRSLGTVEREPVAGKTEPWLDCRQRGGRFDSGSRVCKLPEDTVEHMFLAN